MHTDQLLYLIEISNSPSINAASEKLHISYQALSHSVRALEKELGLSLLTRTNKGSVLTEDGEKIVTLAKQFIKGIEQIQAQKRAGEFQVSGPVHLITTEICLEYFLFDLMDYCKKSYPQIQFDYHISYCIEETIHLLRTDPSCFFVSLWGIEAYESALPEDIRKAVVAHTALKCVCSPMHELASYQSVSFRQLQKYELLVRHSTQNAGCIPDCFHAIVSEPNPLLFEKKILSENYISFIYAVPFAPYWIPQINNVARIDVHTDSDAHLALCYHKDFQQSPQTRLFLETLYRKFGVKELAL